MTPPRDLRSPVSLVVVLAAAVFLASCVEEPPTAPHVDTVATGFDGSFDRRGAVAVRGLEGEFVRIARDVRGFGGMYRDERGRLNVYLTDPSLPTVQLRHHLDRALSPGHALAAGPQLASSEMVVHQGRYDFVQLSEWHQRMLPLLAMDGVVFTHVDERHNRLGVGVQPHASWDEVERRLEDLGVPVDAVAAQASEAVVPLVGNTLRDLQRPRAGGPRIMFQGPGGGWFACTLGFNIIRDGAPGRSTPEFITNSHCSESQGQVTGTRYYQALPEVFGGHPREFIGAEVLDPPLFSAPCFIGFVCRWSDALVARYEQGSAVQFGSIYRTRDVGEGSATGSIELADRGGPFFRIRGEQAFPLGGESLGKVGQTTGWTRGPVVITCGNFEVDGTAVPTAMLCQDGVAAASGPGDSGSPVFRETGQQNQVDLYGILWGGATIEGVGVFIFSAMENIRFDLGGFDTH